MNGTKADTHLTDKLGEIADKLSISFDTAQKVHEGTTKNWRNAVVHGVHIREQTEEELSHEVYRR